MNLSKCIQGLYLLLFLGIFVSHCGPKMDAENEKQRMLETDHEFSKMSVEKGRFEAFYYYLADDGKVLPKIGEPLTKDDYKKFMEQFKNQERIDTLKWEPTFADIALSGELGYTQGKYEFITTDSVGNKEVSYGNYVTIWKKQSDGSWKFVFDAGNDLPKEEN